MIQTVEQRVVDNILSTLRAKTNVAHVCEGDVQLGDDMPLPATFVECRMDGAPVDSAFNYVTEVMAVAVRTLFEFDPTDLLPGGRDPLASAARDIMAQQQQAMLRDRQRGQLNVDTAEGERSFSATARENVGLAEINFRVTYERLRDDPAAFDEQRRIA